MERFTMETAIVDLLQEAISTTSEQERNSIAEEMLCEETAQFHILSEVLEAERAELKCRHDELRDWAAMHFDLGYGLFAALSFPKGNPVRRNAVKTIRYLARVNKWKRLLTASKRKKEIKAQPTERN